LRAAIFVIFNSILFLSVGSINIIFVYLLFHLWLGTLQKVVPILCHKLQVLSSIPPLTRLFFASRAFIAPTISEDVTLILLLSQ
jgi:hypothetical protein